MRKNKLYTLSYFRKRLHDSKIKTSILVDRFSNGDARYWMIIIDGWIVCTCFIEHNDKGEKVPTFHFTDGSQHIPFDMRKQTDSMNVITNYVESILLRLNKNEKDHTDTTN